MALPKQQQIGLVLIQVLAARGGSLPAAEAVRLVDERFPQVSPDERALRTSDGRMTLWHNRIHWARNDLRELGVIDPSARGVWKLTERGWELAQRNATAEEVAALSSARTPRRPSRPGRGPVADAAAAPLSAPPVLAPLVSRSDSLIAELQAAAVDSKDPDRLERAVAETFRLVGFLVNWIGGPGKTDVLLRAPLGIRRYTVVVDAKSTARPKVADAQVDWLSIRTHREKERADYACLVGPGFAGGQLFSRAQEFDTALLTVDDLCEVVRIYAEVPLTLTELRALFTSVPAVRDALPELRAKQRERRRKHLLIARLLAHIDYFNQSQPEIVLAKPETLFASILGERNADLLGTTLDDVRRALTLLETLGIIAANGDGYVSETSPEGARQILSAYADAGTVAVVDSQQDRRMR